MARPPYSLQVSPDGLLTLAASESAAGPGHRAVGEVILQLAAEEPPDDLCLAWIRLWACRFLATLCQNRSASHVPCPDPGCLRDVLEGAPPLPGSEYLRPDSLSALWMGFQQIAVEGADSHAEGLEGWLRERFPLWRLVGRVTLHLAENKSNATRPFAFLATYSDQITGSGRLQHLPLGRALDAFASQKNQAALDSLLLPVRAACKESPFLHQLLESRRLFQALAWAPEEAHQFLTQIPVFESAGLVVKVPDWWRNKKSSRPVLSITIDAGGPSGLGLRSMLQFHAALSLDGTPLTPEEQRQIRESPSGLVNLRGQWVELDRDQLNAALAHWERVQAAHQNGTLSFHEGMRWLAGFSPRPTAAGASSDSPPDWTEVLAGKNLERLLDTLRTPAPIESIPGLSAVLRPYQQRGVAWLDALSRMGLGACLADDMGLGKTLQVIALLCLLKSRGAAFPSLLVLPASLLGNWSAELRRFAPQLRFLCAHPSLLPRETLQQLAHSPEPLLGQTDLLLTTYGYLQRLPALFEASWELALLDEAQAVKNPGTAQARAVRKIKARARIALTGTPVENQLGDLWSLFDFLNPGLLGSAEAFAGAVQQMARSSSGYAPLRRLTAPYLLRRLKTDRSVAPDLPDKTELTAHCPLSRKQAVLYGRLVAQLRADLSNPQLPPFERQSLVLSFLLKFKQVCNHPSHWSGDGRFAPADSGKFLRLNEITSELAQRQERCLVFTQFREMTGPLADYLASVFGRPGLVLHGGTPVARRSALVEQFQKPDGPPFFVLTVKSGGTGLNLTAASHVIHFDRWWNPAVENQATDRAFRIGQKRNVLVHKFVCPGTIEEKVDQLIASKSALANDLLRGEGGTHQLLTELSNEELLSLVRLDLHHLERSDNP
ncbi:MAG: hypothetical protein RLZZ244_1220 [Verrucomicrobiota bacterium]|jgi:non-specific serine/threonine protein kinase